MRLQPCKILEMSHFTSIDKGVNDSYIQSDFDPSPAELTPLNITEHSHSAIIQTELPAILLLQFFITSGYQSGYQ